MKHISISASDSPELLLELRAVVEDWVSRQTDNKQVLFMQSAISLATAAMHMARAATPNRISMTDDATKERVLAFLSDVSGCQVVRVDSN